MGLSLNLQLPTADLMQKQANQQYLALLNKTNFANFMGSQLTGLISDGIGDAFGDSGIGRQIGNVFGNGLGSIGGTMLSNYLKGNTLMQGVSKNLGASLQGAASGLAADFAGRGVNALMGDSKLGNFAGGATSSALGLILGGGIGNPITFGANVLGSGLSSMLGPSKEYGGRYGNITLTMDSIYGGIQGVAGLFGPVGMGVSAAMALNKGLSNLFGSTDAMTKQDAILGSAFMPAPVKWLNAGLGKKTGSFDNQSWQNQEKANSFMQNGFGDLGERFDLARYEANKKYGLFSQHARRKAQRNIDFANIAWDLVLAMADLNELQNIRSLYMSSINNLRYALMLGGGLKPLLIGKQGMKILNNQTNHNMGLRLLSAAALIDNKQMILSAQGGTKITRLRAKPLPKKPATREENPELWDEWERREAEQLAARLQVYDLERLAAIQRAETNARHALHYSNLAMEVAETAQQNAQFEPVTQESLQNSNTERLRQELLANKNEYFDNGMKFINAAGFADLGVNIAGPLLLRGFKWAFDKAGLLVRVPKLSKLFSLNLNSEKFINPDGSINVQKAVPEIVRGKNFAIEYLNSPTRTAVNAHNKELADRLGFKLFRPFNEAGQRVSTPSNLKIVRENSSVGGSVSTDSRNPAADLVTINLYNSDPYFASIHENLHRGYLGNAPKEYFLNETRGTFGDTNRFYDYLKDKLLKPWSERYNLPAADYLDLSAELAVNMFEVGQRMGLKVGLKFPGKLKVLELLEKYKNSGDYKSGVVDHLNLKHPLRIWKALTGTLFSLPLIYGTVNNTIGLKTQ